MVARWTQHADGAEQEQHDAECAHPVDRIEEGTSAEVILPVAAIVKFWVLSIQSINANDPAAIASSQAGGEAAPHIEHLVDNQQSGGGDRGPEQESQIRLEAVSHPQVVRRHGRQGRQDAVRVTDHVPFRVLDEVWRRIRPALPVAHHALVHVLVDVREDETGLVLGRLRLARTSGTGSIVR